MAFRGASTSTSSTTSRSGADRHAARRATLRTQIPVAHLAFETDIHFSIIHCPAPTN
jgi:hypothetical protein